MSKKLMSTLLAGVALCSASLQEEDMQLVNNKNGFIVAEIVEGECIIHDRFLKASLEKEGITIPKPLRPEFNDQDRIFVTDALFEKALREVFYQLRLAHSDYEWVEYGTYSTSNFSAS